MASYSLILSLLLLSTPLFASWQPVVEKVSVGDRKLVISRQSPVGDKPYVVMHHGLGSDRNEWTAFAKNCVEKGYGVVLVDARGHGESAFKKNEYKSFGRGTSWNRMIGDYRQVLNHIDHPSILAGASLGANIAIHVLADSNEKILLGLALSPGVDYAGIQTQDIVQNVKKPLLLIASPEDRYAFGSARFLKDKNPDVEFWSSPEDGHGVNMLDKVLTKLIFEWLEKQS